jgi:succinate dehydrogenase / fumarate reductase membrane anchor subunit
MATATKTAPASGKAVPQINRFETAMWRYMRLSGVLLVPLAFIHLGIMHIINSVYTIDYQWVIEKRWALLGWRVYDAFLLWFGGIHGYNGLRIVINDYVHNPTVRRVLIGLVVIVALFVFYVGTVALLGAPFKAVIK